VVSLLRSPATEVGFLPVPAAATVTADPIPAVAPVSRSHNLEGRQLGSYRIAARLGAGGMGDVYRAYDQTLHRPVAIKVLRADEADEGAARGRLLREARAAAALNHPNICTIHEVGEDNGQAFLAMELVDGEPLHRVIPPGTGLPVNRLLACAIQVADALAHAHERGVLHRDLKAQNIVITPAGRAKVLDFGLAKRIVSEASTSETLSVATASGILVGTPAYVAPEQLRGQPADALSDI
jgi:serine/threonine-protein kinase